MRDRITIPGGGNNDRKAARIKRTITVDDTTSQWENCEFEELRRGDIAIFFEKDGALVVHSDGSAIHWIHHDPFKDDGVWTIGAASVKDLAAADATYVAKHGGGKS